LLDASLAAEAELVARCRPAVSGGGRVRSPPSVVAAFCTLVGGGGGGIKFTLQLLVFNHILFYFLFGNLKA
jgi:hypothetical protein